MTISIEEPAVKTEVDEKLDGPSLATPPSIEGQAKLIKSCLLENLQIGQTWFVLKLLLDLPFSD